MSWDRRDFLKTAAAGITWGGVPHLAVSRMPASLGTSETASFRAARPIWPAGRSREMNLLVGFHSRVNNPGGGRVVLRIAASSLYRAYLNGVFRAHGPARGPHGYFRIDEWVVSDDLEPGDNAVAIEVAGYNVNSYYLLDQPAFLQAEVVDDSGYVLAATGGDTGTFRAVILEQRVQKVQRYSFQRTFSEVYRLSPGVDQWRTETDPGSPGVACDELPACRLLQRRVPFPHFALRQPVRVVSRGSVRKGLKVENPWRDRSLTGVGPTFKGYAESELETTPSLELQTIESIPDGKGSGPYQFDARLTLSESSCAILDLGTNLTGFLGAHVDCQKPCRLFFLFDEILSHGDVDFKRLGCVNAVVWELRPGTYQIETFEPYTLRYLKLLVLDGECEVTGIYLRELANPEAWNAAFACGDESLVRLFEAGRETFRQNAVDIFMDCPSRERAGWLCDSFFTARAAADLCGNTKVERNFLENYLLPEHFPFQPDGMLPMCYPADHNDGNFIPNWALWFVVQLEEYLLRSDDREMVEKLQPRVMNLFRYFERYLNGDGLLEKLEKWVFIEWSKANSFVQDVNYPSNMLYAAALSSASRLYDLPQLARQAERVRKAIARQSYDGSFFVDNAVRESDALRVTRNRTEVCQYFAFYFGVATPESHPGLWRRLLEDFGPQREKTKAFPEIYPANAFVGNMLRLEILSRYGQTQRILDESIDYLLYMEERTGTLWENIDTSASCNHGFASHIVRTLYRDVLGVYAVDVPKKTIRLRLSHLALPWCSGTIPLPSGKIQVRWRQESNRIHCRATVPAGYRLEVDNLSGKELVLI
jgi:alpha-L-rhamnosidase